MTTTDAFAPIASYYDEIMSHVDYDRWAITAYALESLVGSVDIHLDIGCGTGTLVSRMRQYGWQSYGADLSQSMIVSKHIENLAVANMTRLPFGQCADCVTCLFDSVNFLLDEGAVRKAMGEWYRVLKPGGVLYFDTVTERMVIDHFAGQEWTEANNGFDTTWRSAYSRKTGLSETNIIISGITECLVQEQMYPLSFYEEALADVGFTLFGMFNAETWRKPSRRTTRVDIVAVREPRRGQRTEFKRAAKHMRSLLSNRQRA